MYSQYTHLCIIMFVKRMVILLASKIVSDIRKYVEYLSNNFGLDILNHTKLHFKRLYFENSSKYEGQAVIPELLSLLPAKRSVVVKSIKDVTGIDIAPREDDFTGVVEIKKVGDSTVEIEEDDVSTKWTT